MLESMKTNISWLLLMTCFAGCGNDSKSADPTPVPVISSSPTPTASPTPIVKAEVHCEDAPIVGNWIDAKDNNFKINSDCSAQAGSQKLTWSLNEKNEAVFTSNSLPVDVCAYEVLSQGGLTEALKITLQMICQKGGALSYTKSN